MFPLLSPNRRFGLTIRINSGKCRGMTLRSPRASHTRPTASRVREAVWNSLQETVQGADIMDLFSGSGAVGWEALSRGARSCVFAENHAAALSCLKANGKLVSDRGRSAGVEFTFSIFSGDALSALNRQTAASKDLIWLDPPYDEVPDLIPKMQRELERVLKSEGYLVIEYDQNGLEVVALLDESPSWSLMKQKKYGKTYISILRLVENNESHSLP